MSLSLLAASIASAQTSGGAEREAGFSRVKLCFRTRSSWDGPAALLALSGPPSVRGLAHAAGASEPGQSG